MALLTAYCDETGDTKDSAQKFVGMAGFVAPAEKWEIFERKWKFILREFRVPYFHMKEYAHSNGVFKDWKGNEEKRRNIFGSLIKTIVDVEPLPIGCIFSAEDFRSLPDRDQKIVEDPYFLSFIACLAIPCMFLQDSPPEIKLATVFGEHGVFGSKATDFHRRVRGMYTVGDRLYAPTFRDMREFVPLQAADIMAYELYKEADRQRYNPSGTSRYGIRELVKLRPQFSIHRTTLIIATKKHLEEIISQVKQIRGSVLFGGLLPDGPIRLR